LAISAKNCSSYAGSTTKRRARGTSTVRRPVTFFQVRRSPREARSVRAPAWTSCWRRPTGAPPRCPAWCWLRAGEPVGAQKLFDALQLPRLVEFPDHTNPA
jgi:hypothetical protein